MSITVAVIAAAGAIFGALVWTAYRRGETLATVKAAPDGAPFHLTFATRGAKPHVLRVDLAWLSREEPGDPAVPPIEVEVELATRGGYRTPARTVLASTLISEHDRSGYGMEQVDGVVRVRETHTLATLPELEPGTSLELHGRVSKTGHGTYELVRVFVTSS